MSRFRGQTQRVVRVFSVVAHIVVALIAVALAGGGLAVRPAHASGGGTPPPPSPYGKPLGNWQVITSPNPSTSVATQLTGVSAISPTDVWAVGSYTIPGSYSSPSGGAENPDQTLAMHWDGTQWTIYATPSPASSSSGLNAVAAVSSSDVWAVGLSMTSTFFRSALIEHWNGTQWSISPTPSFGTAQTMLSAVHALSSTDVWAVGWSDTLGPLVLHWGGTSWSIITVPSPSGAYAFSALAAVSANDIWAAGVYYDGTTEQTFADHWNGTQWSLVPMATVSYAQGSGTIGLNGLAATASNDVWAVGFYEVIQNNVQMQLTLTEHWDGANWTQVASPSRGSSDLTSVSAQAPNAVWAVGLTSVNGMSAPLTLYWNGWTWVDVPDAGAPTYSNQLAAVVALPTAGEAWTVGSYLSGGTTWQALTQYYGSTAPAIHPQQLRAPTPGPIRHTIGPRRLSPGAGAPIS